ncbi:hypothetical protein WN943_007499 [Citrus x changshan-huyou]
MENCTVNISEEMRAAESKKQALQRSFDIAHEQASSVHKFTVKWRDLEEHFDLIRKSLEKPMCETKLKCEKKELEWTQSSIKELSVKFDSEEEKLQSFRRRVREQVNEVESKERELDSMKRQQKKYFDDIGMKEMEYKGLRKYVEDLSQELASKDKQLKFFEK